MSIYTKRGDRGITDMAHAGNISKSDDRKIGRAHV